jgi:hypothetical protein
MVLLLEEIWRRQLSRIRVWHLTQQRSSSRRVAACSQPTAS